MAMKILTLLRQLIETIDELKFIVNGMDKSEFLETDKQNILVFRAVKNCFTEIGEIAVQLPSYVKDRNSHVNWNSVIGMRNIIVHQYDKIELILFWQTVNNGPLEELEKMARNEIDKHKKVINDHERTEDSL